jgi:hypothetical protein
VHLSDAANNSVEHSVIVMANPLAMEDAVRVDEATIDVAATVNTQSFVNGTVAQSINQTAAECEETPPKQRQLQKE